MPSKQIHYKSSPNRVSGGMIKIVLYSMSMLYLWWYKYMVWTSHYEAYVCLFSVIKVFSVYALLYALVVPGMPMLHGVPTGQHQVGCFSSISWPLISLSGGWSRDPGLRQPITCCGHSALMPLHHSHQTLSALSQVRLPTYFAFRFKGICWYL